EKTLQVRCNLRRGRIALPWILAKALHDDGLEVNRGLRVQTPKPCRLGRDDVSEGLLLVLSLEGRPPGDHLVERGSEAVNVRSRAERFGAMLRLLGAHVLQRPRGLLRERQARLPRHPGQ